MLQSSIPYVRSMGFIRTKVYVGAADLKNVREELFLADTGSWYMVLTPKLAEELSLKPVGRVKLTLADKRVVEADVAAVYVKLLEREAILTSVIMDTPEPLLGISTMEALGLELDPTTGDVRATKPALLLV